MLIRCLFCVLIYLLDITLVRSDCVSDAKQQLQSMHNAADEVEITWLDPPPQADDVFHAIEGKHIPMKAHLFMLVCADGKRYKGRVEPCVRVPVVTADTPRGTILQHMEVRSVPCRLVGPTVVKSVTELQGMETKIQLKAGQPIHTHHVQKPKLVKKGDTITVQYQTPYFTVSNQGVAQSDAALNEVVNVTFQKKTVSARVVNANLARMDRL